MSNSGKFVAFEGIDGSGKSHQIRLLCEKIRDTKRKTYETFEPTDSPIGSLIHQMMTGRINSNDKTIAALFVADRLDHLLNDVNGILQKVVDGNIVLTDRYYFSSYAYHGIHMPLEWVIDANHLCHEILKPDINIFIDVPPERCLERINKERWHLELYENLENMKRVRDKYFEAFDVLSDKEHIVIIDGDRPAQEVADAIWTHVEGLL